MNTENKSQCEQPKRGMTFILDVDGVLTDGSFYYSESGKVFKKFGPDDNDALQILKNYLDIVFVTGDSRGFEITKKRVEVDMEFPLFLVSTHKRLDWIKARYDLKQVVYMGDGFFDHLVFENVAYSIAPQGADPYTSSFANYVTSRRGGDRAVAEAAVHIMREFFPPYDPKKLHSSLEPRTGVQV
jgi:3-deoxy-D-manno-octulosonate 8-phosphate phosphatase (KDO 8-P phosphatase)